MRPGCRIRPARCDTAETYRRSLELTQNRRRGGIATDLDVAQAETQLRTAEAAPARTRLQRAAVAPRAGDLVRPAGFGFSCSRGAPNLTSRHRSRSALPSELLERRPDIAAAERRMAAANAQIGVAQAAFYPARPVQWARRISVN